MDTVPARQLLTSLRPDMEHFFYAHYNMNLYRGCSHGCIYCDSRSLCYHLTDFDHVRVKKDALPCWTENCVQSDARASLAWAP